MRVSPHTPLCRLRLLDRFVFLAERLCLCIGFSFLSVSSFLLEPPRPTRLGPGLPAGYRFIEQSWYKRGSETRVVNWRIEVRMSIFCIPLQSQCCLISSHVRHCCAYTTCVLTSTFSLR